MDKINQSTELLKEIIALEERIKELYLEAVRLLDEGLAEINQSWGAEGQGTR